MTSATIAIGANAADEWQRNQEAEQSETGNGRITFAILRTTRALATRD
jgi:hypothetical protein